MCLFSVFTSLLIESKETLETIKIVGLSPCATLTNKNPNKIKLSKVGLRLSWSSRTSALGRRSCALNRTAIDPLLVCASAGALVPWLGHSSVNALDRRSPTIDRSGRNSSFFQVCSLSLIFPEMLPFLPKTYKTQKTQKENKIE